MANMSYCRFENTYKDLRDAFYHMEDEEELSASETKFRAQLIKLCKEVAGCYADADDDE